MSKLVQAIEARETGKRFAEISPLLTQVVWVEEETTPSLDTNYINYLEYRIKATFGCIVKIKDNSSELNTAISHTKKAVVEAIFGEFRENFRLIHQVLWERDIQKATKLLDAFEKKMFTDE